jgi:hypothetical protein
LLTCLLYRLLCGFVRLLARRGAERELEVVVLRHPSGDLEAWREAVAVQGR